MKKVLFIITLLMTGIFVSAQELEKEKAISFSNVQKAPVYPDCKGDNNALKKCFNRKFQMHFARNFNPGLINNRAFNSVNKKFFILFTINKEGLVDSIQVKRAPHKRLEEESKRVIRLLPKIIPGEVKGKPVSVKYTFPFSMRSKDK